VNDTQVLEDASKAAARIKKGAHLTDWFAVGAGLVAGQTQCLRETGANDRNNKRYQNCFNKWMDAHKWSLDFDQTTRSHVVWLHENRDAVNEFLAPLASNQRQRMNHPSTVKRAFDKAHKPAVEKEPKEPKPDERDARIEELEGELVEANEKIASLETVIADGEWTPPADEVKALRDKLFDAEQQRDIARSVAKANALTIERLEARIAELEGPQPPKPTGTPNLADLLNPALTPPKTKDEPASVIVVPAEPGQVAAPATPTTKQPRKARTNTGFKHVTLSAYSGRYVNHYPHDHNARADYKKYKTLIDVLIARGETNYDGDDRELMTDEGRAIHDILLTGGLATLIEAKAKPTPTP
jgi:hypothetical protein